MTAGGDNGKYGDRIAAVFFKSESGIMISSAVNGDKNFRRSFNDELTLDDWNNIVISQEFEGLKLMYKVINSNFHTFVSELRTNAWKLLLQNIFIAQMEVNMIVKSTF